MLEAPFVESLEGISISSFFNLRRCEMFHGDGEGEGRFMAGSQVLMLCRDVVVGRVSETILFHG